ncbi:MAG: ATP-dependent DNA helicase RecG [Cytophagaceae bacterium]|nr:ATP-dependent DNA helicase RecG [Cytophagaceae bacterium]MDW8455797.1 ATP-dependent DNA helicase RecG [Cytophagaceae bacterium]
MPDYLDTKIEFLKGVGPQKASLLNTEFNIFTYRDLLNYFPFRYEDRTKFHSIAQVHEDMPFIQLRGYIKNMTLVGKEGSKRLVAEFHDATGCIELVWFRGLQWVTKSVKTNIEYILFGKPSLFGSKLNIAHPELEIPSESALKRAILPVYHTTEKAKKKNLDSKSISKLIRTLLDVAGKTIDETLPEDLRKKLGMLPLREAYEHIHFPSDFDMLNRARYRLKFDELFFIQLKLLQLKNQRKTEQEGFVFKKIPTLNEFYKHHLPFELTNAQKRVIREIYDDMCSGKQMNRLLQGDVGSGKTMVAFFTMLMAVDNDTQACLMAPTEILAEQHYRTLKEYAEKIHLPISILTGSTKKSERNILLEQLKNGEMKMIVGTHALIEDDVQFKKLGVTVIDEQHRFGVAQRAKLWQKNHDIPPHVLVMTATPIPRTLAMTLYGDLDVSVIDELPKGRKPVKTVHRYDSSRLNVFAFLRKQIEEGRQIYVVYPLVEESEKTDLKHVMDGYESMCRAFGEGVVSIMYGKMTPEAKEFEMQRFLRNETKIMVATTVIEVGVNVPNATVMVIENAERFGLSQLHQLRGRVGRGAEQSYCILMTGYKLTKEARIRIDTMVRTNNGFEIADVDLKLRGPGDLTGTQQSGIVNLRIADLAQDAELLKRARNEAMAILQNDPELQTIQNLPIRTELNKMKTNRINWSKIS